MRYLITVKGCDPFLTAWFDYENHFIEGMVIYNINNWTYSTNGIDFKEIDIDHL